MSSTPSFSLRPNMLIVSTTWNEKPSFKLIPVTTDCPYIEIIFDPESRALGVISKEHKPKMQLVARIDENGDPILRKGKRQPGQEAHQVQRLMFDAYYEYLVDAPQDIQALVELMASNPEHAVYRQFFPTVNSVIQAQIVDGVQPAYQTELVAAHSETPAGEADYQTHLGEQANLTKVQAREVTEALLIDQPAPHPETMTRNPYADEMAVAAQYSTQQNLEA